MDPRRILVTGAAGFVGRHLLVALRDRFPHAAVIHSPFDVTDQPAVARGVAVARPDAVVHLAGVAAPVEARREPDRAWQVNLHGTLNLARAVLDAVPDCVLLFASSADAYGASFRAGVPVDEAAPLAPLNTYGATKAAADLALGAMAAEGLRCVRVRPFNHTGPGQHPAFVVAAFAQQVARVAAGLQPPVLEVGALEPERDFLDVRDVCAAYASVLARADALAPGMILNVASGSARRIGDILHELLDTAGVRAEVRTDAARLRPADIPVARGDAGLARRLLDWAPRIPWRQTLADVLEDWRRRVRA
ncbi:MAG: GDP-mannose 4,6-dehydratase [Acetobacteraceae bacterium]|nr:GDP-mannose 4,6-dehydratase [Acetobacteraceae bacterium]